MATQTPKNSTEPDKLQLLPDNAEKLRPVQREAVRLLLIGLRPGKVAERLSIHRSTLWTWMRNETFQQVLRESQENLFQANFADEAAAFKSVEGVPLLTMGGLKRRLELVDVLLLRDLQDKRPQRATLIARLQNMLTQAQTFLDKLDADTVAKGLFQDQAQRYRERVLSAVARLLVGLPDSEVLLGKFSKQLDKIDLAVGIE